MEVGTGIAVGSIVLGLAAIIITCLALFRPVKARSADTCSVHATTFEMYKKQITDLCSDINRRDDDLWKAIDGIREDIKKLLMIR